MVLEPSTRTFKAHLKMRRQAKKLFNIRRYMSMPGAFELYYFQAILNW
jgi:hypothetical protein